MAESHVPLGAAGGGTPCRSDEKIIELILFDDRGMQSMNQSLPTGLDGINDFLRRLKQPNFLIYRKFPNRSNASYPKWFNDLQENM